MQQNNKEQEIEKEKDKLKSAINLVSDKLTKINISLDVLRTNINVSQFFLNELYKNISKTKGEKLDKENKEKIIKTIQIYENLKENELLDEIHKISEKILLLKITGDEKK